MTRTYTPGTHLALSSGMLQTTIGPKPRKDVVGAAARSAAELAAFRGILAGIAAGGLLWLAIAKLLF